MLKSSTRFATLAIASTLVIGGGMLCVHGESAYNSAAVAGITLSVNDYVSSIEDTAPAVTEETSETEKESSGKYDDFVMANVENVVNVRKKGSTDSKVVGQMYKGDAGTLVKKGKTWSKIKSGNVTGYVKNEFLLFGDDANAYAEKICNKIATVNTTTLNVREKKSAKSDIITQIPEGGEYIVKQVNDNWIKIAVDEDLKGYVSVDYVDVEIDYGEALTMKEIQEIEEANAAAAAAAAQAAVSQTTTTITSEKSVSTIKPTKKSTITNSSSSSFSSDSSVSSASTSTSGLGSQIAQYALQFVGNPYVYGGTSLTNGTDCSGFTMSVYAHFGYGLSRTAAAQASNGTSVSLSNLQPGDLLFYNNGGGIGHVALYIGGGQVVHASSARTGIKISAYNYRTPCKAVRIVR